jgi:DNA-binding beta-propeller fold protein YncE
MKARVSVMMLVLSGLLFTMGCQRSPVSPTSPVSMSIFYTAQLGTPGVGVALNASGDVYVENKQISQLSANGTPMTQWGNGVWTPSIAGIGIGPSGNVYVVDEGNNRVDKFSSNGSPITEWGTFGKGQGQFESPNGIAISASGIVYVADSINCRIEEFSSTGTYLGAWGSLGHGNGQLNTPTAIAVNNTSGDVYVADFGNQRVQEFTSTGTYITQWGSKGNSAGQFSAPAGIAISSSGNVFVADDSSDRIQEFSSSGIYITQWNTPAVSGYLDQPDGIAINANGIYIANELMPSTASVYN